MNSINTTTVAQDLAKRDAFAQKIMKTLKQIGVREPMFYDKDKFAITTETSSMTLNLSNAFAKYKTARGHARNIILTQFVVSFKEAMKAGRKLEAPFSDARNHLRPLVRSKALTDNERYMFKGDDLSMFKPTPRQSFSRDTNILLGYDAGNTVMTVDQWMLDKWEVSYADALDIAMANLAAVSEPRFKEIKPGLFTGDWNDYYDSSRLLLPALFSACSGVADPVIMIPTSELIYVADKTDTRAQLDMLQLVNNGTSAVTKVISTQMYHFVDGTPTEYEPEDNQVLRTLNDIRKPLLQKYAQHQKKVAEEHVIETGNWAYFYSLQLFRDPQTGETGTMSIWSADMECIFPEADIIVVATATKLDDGGYVVRNDPVLLGTDVIEKHGHLVQKMDGFPTLYRAAPFVANNPVMAEAA
ncbi:DUF1444 family protein [Ralstonia syzygii]|uniref:Uncharacterized protein n=1 Tax=Ralstonia syzygii R24 TaxID=907261 RepID=G3A631_9RALS|nr:DUF1444 family protein [Ralstonia syzygii]CCA85909.1 conserved hypothetical protein [Ralstonia syzygii R24]